MTVDVTFTHTHKPNSEFTETH